MAMEWQYQGDMSTEASKNCGWGRVIFAQTYPDPEHLAEAMLKERPGKRDIAAYVRKPHVVLSVAPQQLFLDPSDMLRLDLEARRVRAARIQAQLAAAVGN